MEQNTVYWEGVSGQRYKYFVYPRGTTFLRKPGNYIFTKKSESGSLVALYVGETGDLYERLNASSHERATCAEGYGWDSICVHLSSDDASIRRAEEADIRERYNPPCNRE